MCGYKLFLINFFLQCYVNLTLQKKICYEVISLSPLSAIFHLPHAMKAILKYSLFFKFLLCAN